VPPATTAILPTGFSIDEAQHTIRFVRELAAAPQKVFAAWTSPEQLSCWWDPSGAKLAVCEMDVRPGGAFRFVSQDHPEMPFTGTYLQIAPPGRLEFEAMGALGKVTLTEQGQGTAMTVEIVCRSAEHLAQFVQHGVATGTSQTLDNLVAFAR
jgi:uncharacterized protein YndB with AHSA1/START domain